jgi:hypothetical protein
MPTRPCRAELDVTPDVAPDVTPGPVPGPLVTRMSRLRSSAARSAEPGACRIALDRAAVPRVDPVVLDADVDAVVAAPDDPATAQMSEPANTSNPSAGGCGEYDPLRKLVIELEIREKRRVFLVRLINDLSDRIDASNRAQHGRVLRNLKDCLQRAEADFGYVRALDGVIAGLKKLMCQLEIGSDLRSEPVADAVETLLLEVDYYRSCT